ncbi:MAG: hypothetical protein Q9171_002195 [Xanthocarpia ochracea]
MPSNSTNSKKRRSSSAGGREDYDSDNGFIADAPKSKKTRITAAPSRASIKSATSSKPANNSNGSGDEEFWEITSTRRVNISEFKGQRMVNIREYYEDKSSGAMLPGKKGISLPIAQYSTLLALLPEIEAALVAKGEMVPRPDYSTARPSPNPQNGDDKGDDEDEDEADADDGKKKNFEATSEEDE